jgi:hypothetical protein
MKAAKILLRIASILMFTHLIGHSIGQNGWKNATDPVQKEVGRQMMGPKFPFMGVSRSMGDYFDGYGYITSAALLLFIVLLWIASSAVSLAAAFLTRVVLTLAFGLLAISIVEFIYFFPFAAGTTLLASLLVFMSWYRLSALPGSPLSR